jgi:hypothetical protein
VRFALGALRKILPPKPDEATGDAQDGEPPAPDNI